MKINWDDMLSKCKDYHLPACMTVFGAGAILQWFHHLDMNFVAFTGTVLGAITGHAFSPAQADKPAPPPIQNPNIPPNGQNG